MISKEKIKLLPQSWEEVTLGDFTKLLDAKVSDDNVFLDEYQNTINIAAKLLYESPEQFDDLPMKDVLEITKRLSFMNTDIQHKKNDKFKWKSLDEITMDDYITLSQYGDRTLYNLNSFVKIMNKVELTKEEIDLIPIPEVMYGFFLCRKQLKKYTNRLIALEKKQLIKFKITKIAHQILRRTDKK
jgi:hypothetical protein